VKYIIGIVFLWIFILTGCATRHYIMVPSGVPEVSICDVMKNNQDYLRRDVVLEGKVLSLSVGHFTLQCLHNSNLKIDVDQTFSITKVENTGRKVRVYGKLILRNDEITLLTEDVEIGDIVDWESQPASHQQPRGGGCH